MSGITACTATHSMRPHRVRPPLATRLAAVQRGDFTRGEPLDAIVLLLQEMYRHGDGVPERATILSAVPSRIVDAFHAEHARDVRRVAGEHGLAVLYMPSMRNGAA